MSPVTRIMFKTQVHLFLTKSVGNGNLVYENFFCQLFFFNNPIQISMNAATVAMIATKMQLVQILLDTIIAAVSQDLQEMAANVMV